MSLLDLVAPGVGKLFDIANTVIERLVPDKALAAKIQAETQAAIVQAQLAGELSQLEIDKTEAANPSIFVSGWRPFIGWVCGCALAYEFVVAPMAMWAASWAGVHVPAPPKLDDVLWQLMFGMLGMGSLRSFDKLKGTDTKSVGGSLK